MSAFARPPLLVTLEYLSLADDTPVEPTAPLAKYRKRGGPAAGTEPSLTSGGTGVRTFEIPNEPGAEYRIAAGSSYADDECDVEEVTYTIPASTFTE